MKKSEIKMAVCELCGICFKKRFRFNRLSRRYYCSNNCRREDKNSHKSVWTEERRQKSSEKVKGKDNPNYGNAWSSFQRHNASELKKQQYAEIAGYAYNVGKSNRGIKFSKERVASMHSNRTSESYSRVFSEETKLKIGVKSKEKFTVEFKLKRREVMEEKGHWRKGSEVSEYEKYFSDSDWVCSMFAYFSEKDVENFERFGVYNSKNTKGFVRDHHVSRDMGFRYKVPAYILRHPCNMRFVSHSENIKKGFRDRKLSEEDCLLALKNLFISILNFSKDWVEQSICVEYLNCQSVCLLS